MTLFKPFFSAIFVVCFISINLNAMELKAKEGIYPSSPNFLCADVIEQVFQEYIEKFPIDFMPQNSQPIIIPNTCFYEDKFSYATIFGPDERAALAKLLNQFSDEKRNIKDDNTANFARSRAFLYPQQLLENIDGVKLSQGGVRSKIANLRDCDTIIIKVPIGAPCRGNPFAHPLRVYNGKRLRDLIEAQGWDMLSVPKEGLIPLISEGDFSRLTESDAVFAFLVASEKVNINETKELLKLDLRQQIRAAIQLCQLIVASNLSDVSLVSNVVFSKGKLHLIDTEPLFGEVIIEPVLMIDKLAKEYYSDPPPSDGIQWSDEKCKKVYIRSMFSFFHKYKNGPMGPLKGLNSLKESSKENGIFTFFVVAKKFIEHYQQLRS